MNLSEMVIPRPLEYHEGIGVSCDLEKISWIE